MFSRKNRKGIALLMAMIVLALFATWAVAVHSFSGSTVQIANNQHKVDSALAAAESGIDCARYVISKTLPNLIPTNSNVITTTQALGVWTALQAQTTIAGKTPSFTRLSTNNGDQIVIPAISYGEPSTSFAIRFYRYDSAPLVLKLESTGTSGPVTKKITMDMKIGKDAQVLEYAISSRARVWITNGSVIHGNIYSSWKYQNIAPFNMTSDSIVDGTIGTILTTTNPNTHQKGPDLYAGSTKMPYDLETLDNSGNPKYDSGGHKIISSADEIQGQYAGINYDINYGDKAVNMPGMKLADYDTSSYKSQTTAPKYGTPADAAVYNYNYSHGSPTTPIKVTEYFPHNAGDYTHGPSGSLQLSRYVCQDKTLTDFKVLPGRNALFQHCTFDGILYVDSNSAGTNDVRFEDCTFNGPIVTPPVTDTSDGWWKRNQLYFTGAETFQVPEEYNTTVLAPNFNVNLGNTDPTTSDHNLLTGAIVGGIVDVRGTTQVNGTIISMFDTSGYSSGYVSNIGSTTEDGGSETQSSVNIDNIVITPAQDRMLPSGITTPITIDFQQDTYAEVF